MKNLIKTFCVPIFIGVIISTSSYAQEKAKAFEGTITYGVSVESEELKPEYKARVPNELKMTFKGTKSRVEQISPAGSTIILADAETMESTILFNHIMVKKMAVKSSKEDMEKALTELPEMKINILDETKEIIGYKCKKAEIVQGENTLIVYYTDALEVSNPNWSNQFKDIKGVMLEYTQFTGGMTMKYTAKSVEKQNVNDSVFTIPDDYKVMTNEEFRSMFKK